MPNLEDNEPRFHGSDDDQFETVNLGNGTPEENVTVSMKLSPKKTGRLYMELQDALSEIKKLKKENAELRRAKNSIDCEDH